MVIALLVYLGATVATGLIAYGEHGKGPLAGSGTMLVIEANANGKEPEHRADSEGGAERSRTSLWRSWFLHI
jgi:hypothetical protein